MEPDTDSPRKHAALSHEQNFHLCDFIRSNRELLEGVDTTAQCLMLQGHLDIPKVTVSHLQKVQKILRIDWLMPAAEKKPAALGYECLQALIDRVSELEIQVNSLHLKACITEHNHIRSELFKPAAGQQI